MTRKRVVRALAPFELYGLVNNAGYPGTGAIEDVDEEAARLQLDLMALVPMRLACLALPAMRARASGRIVNISSIYGRVTTSVSGWYQASKHALEAASDALRTEVASSGVRVVLIEPGAIRTGIWDEIDRDLAGHVDSRFLPSYRRVAAVTHRTQPLMSRPSRVAEVVVKALDCSHPRPRYLVGVDARALALAEALLPTAVKDQVVRKVFSL